MARSIFLAVTVKESVDPELLLQEPKEVLLEQLPRPETPREHENAQAIADREARDQLARDKINLENEERRARGPKVGHNVYYNEVQKESLPDYSWRWVQKVRRNSFKRTPMWKCQN